MGFQRIYIFASFFVLGESSTVCLAVAWPRAVGYALLQLGWAIFIISRVANLSDSLVDQPRQNVSNAIKNEHLGMGLPTYCKFLGMICVFHGIG